MFFQFIVTKMVRILTIRSPKKVVFHKNMPRFYNVQVGQKSSVYIQNFIYFAMLNFVSVAKMEEIERQDKGEGGKKLTVQSAITQSDELFLIGKFSESYTILSDFKESDDPEVLWRLSRALYNMSKQKGISKSEKEAQIKEAYHHIDKALSLNNEHYAIHKWTAILLDAKSSLESIKTRIKNLPLFKKHLSIAIELNPKDATSIHMLGQYMYNIADMSWLQVTVAKTLFGTPPEASFEEAFYYFTLAEEVEPNFYSANLLMLGKTCLKLNRIEAAQYWLKCATSYPVRTDEDEAVRLEAEALLKKYPTEKLETKFQKE